MRFRETLERSCRLRLLDFEYPEGKKIFWHSFAHLFGECTERRWGLQPLHPTASRRRFHTGEAVHQSNFEPLENIANKGYQRQTEVLIRLEMTQDQLL